jgi:nucleoside-diphosphate-sugar epimerase
MKLIVTGASGYVGTEVIRKSLSLPQITSVIALARQAVSVPNDLDSQADVSKLQSIIIKDYNEYPDGVKEFFVDADACIWYISILSINSKQC